MITQSEENQNLKKKRMIKLSFIILLTAFVVSNAMIAWALPKINVECCQDIVLEFFNETFYQIQTFRANSTILFILFGISDFIFFYSLYKQILIKGKLKFAMKLFILILIKIILDYVFFQKNIYNNYINPDDKFLNFSITNYLNKKDSSLFSISISLIFQCTLEFVKKKNEHSILRKLFVFGLVVHLIFLSVFLLFSNMIFAYQVLFSFLIVDYMNRNMSYLIVNKY
jgi:hypothetical protein